MTERSSWLRCLSVSASLAACVGVCAAQEYEAITQPSQDVTLAFVRAGRIEHMLVKEGDRVKAEQMLVRLDDAAEQALLAQLKAQAEDVTRIKAAEAQLAQKKVDMEEIQWAFDNDAATKMEVEHAKLDVTIADLSLVLAKFQHEQDKRKHTEASIQVSRMRLLSPIDGLVEHILKSRGESADALEDVVRVVKIDPLWVDVPVPVGRVRALKLAVGSKVTVAFPSGQTDQSGPVLSGKIIHVAAVADAGSDTRMVRLEVPNKAQRPAGEHVKVSFAASGDRPAKPTRKKAGASRDASSKKEPANGTR